MLAAWDGVFVSAWRVIISERSCRGGVLLLFAPSLFTRTFSSNAVSPGVVGCLEKRQGCLFPSWRCDCHFVSAAACHIPQSFASLVRFPGVSAFRPRQLVSPRPSCRIRRGARRGGICPVLDLPHPIQSCCLFPFQFLALLPLARSCWFACLNWSPAPGRGRRGRFGRFAAADVRSCLLAFSFPRAALSLAARSLSLPCPVSLRRDHMTIMPSIVFVFLRRAWRGVFSCVSFAASRWERRIC